MKFSSINLEDIVYEMELIKQKTQLKGRLSDVREFEFTPYVEESRERIKKFVEGPDVEYTLASVQVLPVRA